MPSHAGAIPGYGQDHHLVVYYCNADLIYSTLRWHDSYLVVLDRLCILTMLAEPGRHRSGVCRSNNPAELAARMSPGPLHGVLEVAASFGRVGSWWGISPC